MAVKIRFSRIGKKHVPIYRIVAVDSRKKRDGKYLENLGTYNPLTKEIVQFHDDRVEDWISVGAVVVDSVKKLIKIRKKQQKTTAPKAVKKEVSASDKKAAPKKTAAAKDKKPAEKKVAKTTTKKAAESKTETKK